MNYYMNEDKVYADAYTRMLESKVDAYDVVESLISKGWKKVKPPSGADYEEGLEYYIGKKIQGIRITMHLSLWGSDVYFRAGDEVKEPDTLNYSEIVKFNAMVRPDSVDMGNMGTLSEVVDTLDGLALELSKSLQVYKPKVNTMDYAMFRYNGVVGKESFPKWESDVVDEIMRTLEFTSVSFTERIESLESQHRDITQAFKSDKCGWYGSADIVDYLTTEGGGMFGSPWKEQTGSVRGAKVQIKKMISGLIKSGKLIQAKSDELGLTGNRLYVTVPPHAQWYRGYEEWYRDGGY